MTWQELFNLIFPAALAAFGWIMKTLYAEIKELKKQQQETREQFVHKEDLKEFKNDMNRRLDEIKELILFRVKD